LQAAQEPAPTRVRMLVHMLAVLAADDWLTRRDLPYAIVGPIADALMHALEAVH
jgi:hypothetical protein